MNDNRPTLDDTDLIAIAAALRHAVRDAAGEQARGLYRAALVKTEAIMAETPAYRMVGRLP